MGDREDNLRKACKLLQSSNRITDLKTSHIYETEPVGYDDQQNFYNICISFDTDMRANELLDLSQSIEHELLRVRLIKNGPRTIDLDILLYGDEKIDTKRLTVPHPRMYERAFVLIPLSELMDVACDIPTDKGVIKLKEFTF